MIVFYILLLLLVTFSILSLASVITLWSNFKYYKLVYKSLDVNNFTPAYDSEYNLVYSKDGNMIWFSNKNAFLLDDKRGVYIHNSFVTFLNPYSLYWFLKYKKWFNDNCAHLRK